MIQLRHLVIAFLAIIINTSCSDKKIDVPKSDSLELIASYKINVSEPSGLAINASGTVLYTVSDKTSKVYSMSTTGEIIEIFNYEGDDLEGVSTYTGNKLLLAEERTKEIVVFDMGTRGFTKHKINYENNDANSGMEGVTFETSNNTIFVLNEKNPGKLIRLRNDFSVLASYDLDFADDYSGIFYEASSNQLWILSDENKTINKCSISGKLIESFSINATQAEGIAIAGDSIFVVSDAEAKLYIYKKPEN